MLSQREALVILLKHTQALTPALKTALLAKLDELSDQEVYNLGRFLALEKKKSLAKGKKILAELADIEKEIASI